MGVSDKILWTLLVFMVGAKISSKYTKIIDEGKRKKYYQEEDYHSLIELNEKLDEKRKGFFSYKYEMLFLYYVNYDYKSYTAIRNTITPKTLKYRKYYRDIIFFMDIVLLYLNNEIDVANAFFEANKRKINKYASKKRKYYDRSFYKLIIYIRLFYQNNVDEFISIYNENINDEITKYNWAILNYYRCKIYESEHEHEEIQRILKIADEKLQNNGYIDIFENWRKKYETYL